MCHHLSFRVSRNDSACLSHKETWILAGVKQIQGHEAGWDDDTTPALSSRGIAGREEESEMPSH